MYDDLGMQTYVESSSGLNLLITHTLNFCNTDLILNLLQRLIDIPLFFIGII